MTAEAKEQKKLAEVSKKRIEERGSLPGSIVTEIVPAFYTAIFNNRNAEAHLLFTANQRTVGKRLIGHLYY